MSMSKSSKMLQHINYRMRVTIQDGRHLVGNFMAFDRHMNLVLGDCEEHRLLPPLSKTKPASSLSSTDRRTLGLVLLRGEEVVSMTVEGPPPSSDNSRNKSSLSTPSANAVSRPAGRGVPPPLSAQPGLAGPIRGVGGPAPNMMQPQIARPPVNYPPPARPPGPPPQQFMRGLPPQQFMRGPPPPPVYGMGPPPPPPGQQVNQQGQFLGQRGPMQPGMPPPQYGMRPPVGMGPPGGVPMYGPPRAGMPMPPRMPNQNQQNQNQQQ